MTTAAVPKIRSNRHSTNTRAIVGGSVRSKPSAASAGGGSRVAGGGGVRPNPTATPTATPNRAASVSARRTSGRRDVGSRCSATIEVRRCRKPITPRPTSAATFPTMRSP